MSGQDSKRHSSSKMESVSSRSRASASDTSSDDRSCRRYVAGSIGRVERGGRWSMTVSLVSAAP